MSQPGSVRRGLVISGSLWMILKRFLPMKNAVSLPQADCVARQCCASMEKAGVEFKKKPDEVPQVLQLVVVDSSLFVQGKMKGIAFAYDPSRYWIELIDRKAAFSGICANY